MQCTTSFSNPIPYTPLTLIPNYPKKYPTFCLPTAKLQPQSIKPSSHNSVTKDTIHLPPNGVSITSTSNPFVKHCVKLRNSSSYRHSHGSVLVVGTTLIREIHDFYMSKQEQQTAIECLFLLDNAEVPQEVCDVPGARVYVNSLVMKKLSGVQSTESIEAIALMRIPSGFLNLNDNRIKADCKRWFPSLHRILVLEGIQDPGNLGTLLRSALAFKWNGVYLLPGCCDPFNEKALRASRGAAFQLPIVSGNWQYLETLTDEGQLKMLAGHPDNNEADPVAKLSLQLANYLADTPLCLLLGSEGSGLSEKAKKSSQLVSIPMEGHFESLNVAVAGGIFMFVLKSDNQTVL